MLKTALKAGLERVLRARGYELKEIGTPLRGYRACLEYARSRGLTPNTVFDVGVGRGTPWLYDVFPDAKLVLFEPLSVFEPDLNRLAALHRADVHRVALAKEPGVTEIYLNTAYPTSSSVFDTDERFAKFRPDAVDNGRCEQQTVSVETLDRFTSYAPPYVIKLDVEGAEMQVLEGGRRALEHTDFLLTEMSVMRRRNGDPRFAEMIGFLDECGFELFDIPSIAQSGRDGQPIYLDAAFVRKDSHLWP